jgi:hypothetical protein
VDANDPSFLPHLHLFTFLHFLVSFTYVASSNLNSFLSILVSDSSTNIDIEDPEEVEKAFDNAMLLEQGREFVIPDAIMMDDEDEDLDLEK